MNKWSKVHIWISYAELIGLDWNELRALLNPLFDWEATVQATLRTAVSMEKVRVWVRCQGEVEGGRVVIEL